MSAMRSLTGAIVASVLLSATNAMAGALEDALPLPSPVGTTRRPLGSYGRWPNKETPRRSPTFAACTTSGPRGSRTGWANQRTMAPIPL